MHSWLILLACAAIHLHYAMQPCALQTLHELFARLSPMHESTIVMSTRLRLDDVCPGQDVVFHVATAQYFGGEGSNSKTLMHGVNVLGTQNVVDACVIQAVPKLVYTSSASVVFEGKDLVNVDETTPYAANPMDYYTGTKVNGCS